MRVIIQRVSQACVTIEDRVVGKIGAGLCVLVGIEIGDTSDDVIWLATKVSQLRIFCDDEGKMSKSVQETGGEILVISQFTLHASTKKGNRPSFLRAARPEEAVPLYEHFLVVLESSLSTPLARGVFGADMNVTLVNNGPVTLVIDSRQRE